jgi:putative addiction module killer protein
MPLQVHRTDEFAEWLDDLRDRKARAIIIRRIDQLAETGNFGDAEPIGEGLTELRIHYGPGYRVYCKRQRDAVVFVLWAGDKSDQKRDIKKAKQLADDL